MSDPQPSHSEYEPHFHAPVQGVVVGENNRVTLMFQNGEQHTVPFLAPPQPSQVLIGRSGIVSNLKQALLVRDSAGLLALAGLPGIGKTALAVALAHDSEVLAHFSEGVLWAGLGQKADMNTVVAHLSMWGAAMGIRGAGNLTSIEEWVQVLHAAIGMRRMLLVVDDAWQTDLAQVFKIGGPNCGYLLTTRLPQVAIAFAGGGAMTVGELSGDEGLALLAVLAPSVVVAEPNEARDLVRAVGGLPLALTVLGNYLRKEAHSGQPRRIMAALQRLHNVEERLRLEQAQSPLERHPSLPPGTPLSLYAAIQVSYEALPEPLRDALVSLQAFGGKPYTFSEQAALEVSGAFPEVLDALTDYGLLEAVGPARYTLHETVQDFIGSIAVDREVFIRMVRHYLSLLATHQLDYGVLEPEMNNILLAIHVAGTHGLEWYEAFVHGANDAFSFLNGRGQFEAAYGLLHSAVDIAHTYGYKEEEARALRNLGILADLRRDFAEAEKLLLSSFALALEAGDDYGVSSTLLNLGVLETRRDNDSKGEDYFLKALNIARQIPNPGLSRAIVSNLSTILSNLSAVTMRNGEYMKAREYLLEALPLARQGGNLENIASALGNLASVERSLGDKAQADMYREEALELARQTGHAHHLHQALTGAAHVALEDGDKARAKQLYEEALTFAQRARDPLAKSSILLALGWLAYGEANYTRAEGQMQEALTLAREFGGTEHLQEVLGALGWVIAKLGEHERAGPYLQEALTQARNAGHQQRLCGVLINLGQIMRDMGDYTQAGNYVLEAQRLAQEGPEQERIGALLHELGELAIEKEDYAQAERYYIQGFDIARETGHEEGVSDILQDWAMLAWKQQDYSTAEERLQQSVEIARQTQNRLLLGQALLKLAFFYLDVDRPDVAAQASTEALEIGQEENSQLIIAWALFDLARVAHARGHIVEAQEFGGRSLEAFEALDSPNETNVTDAREWLISLAQEVLEQERQPPL